MTGTHSDMLQIIYDRVLPEMEAYQIPDTTENRIAFMEGLRDSWIEDGDQEARPWIHALNLEIIRLCVKKITESFTLD